MTHGAPPEAVPAPPFATGSHWPPSNDEPIRGELLGPGLLETRARQIAADSAVVDQGTGPGLLERFERNSHDLFATHRRITECYARRESLTGEAEWLFDNFHIVRDALREIRTDLPHGYYHNLPKLAGGPLRGWPRVYRLALELVAHTDSTLDEHNLTLFVRSYQTVTALSIGELWAVPIMLRLVLIENLSRMARRLVKENDLHARARRWVARAEISPSDPFSHFHEILSTRSPDNGLALAVLQTAREQWGASSPRLDALEAFLREQRVPVDELLREDRQRQAANQMTVGNCVTSLRLLSALDWNVFFRADQPRRGTAALRPFRHVRMPGLRHARPDPADHRVARPRQRPRRDGSLPPGPRTG